MLAWNDDYIIHIPSIDNEHKLLMGLLNDIEPLFNLAPPIQIPLAITALDRFTDAMQRHFESEEHFLKVNGYPDFEEHHAEHLQLLGRMKRFQQRFREERKPFDERMQLYLRDWFARHIILYDTRIGTYFRGKETIDHFD